MQSRTKITTETTEFATIAVFASNDSFVILRMQQIEITLKDSVRKAIGKFQISAPQKLLL